MRARNGQVFIAGPFFNVADAGAGGGDAAAAAAAGGDAAAAAAAGGDAAAAAGAAAGSGAAGDAAAGSGAPGAAAGGGDAAAVEKPGDAAGEKPGEGAPAGAPEKYDLTLPEGGLFDETDLAAVAEMGKALGWTNEQAQAALTDSAKAAGLQRDRFLETTKAHPVIGGEHLEASQQLARAALDKFLPATSAEGAELRKALDKSGYGNYAPLALFLRNVGAAMKEDTPPGAAAGAGGGKKSHADVLFGPK